MSAGDEQLPEVHDRSLTLRFCALLSLFLVLLGGTYLAVSSGVSAKEHDSLIVNLMGRQRMLTQRYAREVSQALAGLAASDSAMVSEMTRAASETSELYEKTLTMLVEGGEVEVGGEERIPLPPVQDDEIVEQLRGVRAEWESLRRVAEQAMRSDTTQWGQHLQRIQTQTTSAATAMDRVVLLMQKRSEAKLRRVGSYMAWALAAGGLLFVGTTLFVRAKIVVPLANTMTAVSVTNIGLSKEISQRQAAEATLRSVLETAADGIITVDTNGTIQSANRSACHIFGYSTAEEMIGQSVEMLMPQPFRRQREDYFENYLRTGERRIIGKSSEVVGLRRDGSIFPMDLAVGESRLGEDRVFSGIVRDLEQQRGKDERLGHLLKLFVEAADPIVIGDLDGRIIDVNDEAVRVYGFGRDELLGAPLELLMPAEAQSEVGELVDRCRSGNNVRAISTTYRTKAGARVPTLLSLSLLTDEQGQPTAIASQTKDISALKRLQEQLLQAQKLEAIGILAGGIAHDFNNLLTSIRGSSEILIDQLQPDGRLARAAWRIQKAADRAAALTARLLGFSRKQAAQRVAIDVHEAVREIRELFEGTLPEDVEFQVELWRDGLHVRADENQLYQVLTNLVLNAGDAMPAGGKLVVTTAREEVSGERSQILDIPPGSYAALRVRDSGHGIPAELLAQIFDPFFTTKEVGKGTGLGLSTALGIIRENGGAITVETEVGVGTMFTVLLPEIGAPVGEARTTSGALARTEPASDETILLVEDDEIMRDLLTEVLEQEGYVVVSAGDPVEALAQSRAYDGRIALAVTDVVMPNMSGFLLAKELRLEFPTMRVLFMSGYADQELADRGDLSDDDPFIRKPFANHSLLSKVREVLDSAPGDPS